MRTPEQAALLVLETVQEAYCQLDGEFRFSFVNRAAESLFETSRSELLGKKLWEVDFESAGIRFDKKVRQAMIERTSITVEHYSGRRQRWHTISAMPDSSGGIIVHLSDITEHKTTEVQYRLIADNAADVIWLWNEGGG